MDWQAVIAVLIVLGAAVFLVQHVRGMLQGTSSGCAKGCGNCPSNPAAGQPVQLVPLQGLDRKMPMASRTLNKKI